MQVLSSVFLSSAVALAKLMKDTLYLTFHSYVENLSPCRREALNFPPSLQGKGGRGLGFS